MHDDPYPYNARMPPRVGGPAQAAQVREAQGRGRKHRPARAPILPIIDPLSEYDAVIAKAAADDRIIVIKISANFCRACKQIAPKYQRVANTYQQHVEFRTLNYEENRDFCDSLGIKRLPTMQILAPRRGHVDMTGCVTQLEKSLRKYVHGEHGEGAYGI